MLQMVQQTNGMRALVKAKAEPGLWLCEEPIPSIGPEEALIRVNKTGICGTDIHIYAWGEWAQQNIPVPIIVGHEYAGEIVEVGTRVNGLTVGQRVSGEGHVIDMNSPAARRGRFHLSPGVKGIGINIPGAFAEYVRVPAFNIVPLPDEIDDELGAILDPLGNAVHAALSFDLIGEDVLITGAGPIGIMSAAVARHVGARNIVITDINPARLALAGEVIDVVPVDVSKEDLGLVRSRLGIREGFGVGLEMSGSSAALEDMVEHLAIGGNIAMLGISAKPFAVDWTRLVFKMVTLKGIYGREMFNTWHKMLAMLRSGLAVRKVITHRMSMHDYQRGFEIMKGGNCGKIILDWTLSC